MIVPIPSDVKKGDLFQDEKGSIWSVTTVYPEAAITVAWIGSPVSRFVAEGSRRTLVMSASEFDKFRRLVPEVGPDA